MSAKAALEKEKTAKALAMRARCRQMHSGGASLSPSRGLPGDEEEEEEEEEQQWRRRCPALGLLGT